METAVIDASVAVKWFVEEHGTQKALELRDRYIDGELKLIAPQLFPYEVLGLFHRPISTSRETPRHNNPNSTRKQHNNLRRLIHCTSHNQKHNTLHRRQKTKKQTHAPT